MNQGIDHGFEIILLFGTKVFSQAVCWNIVLKEHLSGNNVCLKGLVCSNALLRCSVMVLIWLC